MQTQIQNPDDEEVISRIRNGEIELYEVIMRRYNQRLFRIARAIVLDDAEAEDVVQDAYMRAFEHLDQFEARSQFSTWLTKIAINQALARLRRQGRMMELDATDPGVGMRSLLKSTDPSPEQDAMDSQVKSVLETAIDTLPESYRCVFVFRDVEGMTTPQTAQCLDVTEETVKIRLHRARAMMRREVLDRLGIVSARAFQFLGFRCDRLVNAVMYRLRKQQSSSTS